MESISSWMDGPVLQAGRIIDALHLLIRPGDRIVLEATTRSRRIFSLAHSRSAIRESCMICTWSSPASAGPST